MDGQLLPPAPSPFSPMLEAGFCLRVTIFFAGGGGLLSGLPDYGFDLRFLWFLGPIDSPSYHPSVFLPSSVEAVSPSSLFVSKKVFGEHAGSLTVEGSIDVDCVFEA